MPLTSILDLTAAILGILTAILLLLVRRFGSSTWMLTLFLVPASLASASLALPHLGTDFGETYAVQLSFAFLLLAAPGGVLASYTIDREDWQGHLRHHRLTLIAIITAAPALATVIMLITPEVMADPVSPSIALSLDYPGYAAGAFLLIASVLVLANLEQTLRSAQEIVRWEIKFLLLGMAGSFGACIYIASEILLWAPSLGLLKPVALSLFPLLFLVTCLLILVSWQRSKGRGRIFVSHGLIYSSITLLSVGIYLVASSIMAGWAGRWMKTELPVEAGVFLVLLLALSVILLWTDLRHRIKLWIRRNLLSGDYDYRQYWIEASEKIQSIHGPDPAADALAEIVQRSIGSIHVTVWLRLRSPNRLRLLAKRGTISDDLKTEVFGIAEQLLDRIDPVDAGELTQDAGNEPVTDFLEHTKCALLVPLQSSGRLVGVLTAGANRSGRAFRWEEKEFLGVLARHAAAEFHKTDLLSSVVSAKEAEAFRMFSTFLLHDLKNFASTLSLLASNAEKHHANPEFQRDAFRSVFETSEKMKRLCNNLRAFSGNQAINKSRTDLNEVVRKVADSFTVETDSRLKLVLGELSPLELDPEEMARVIRNLILNAQEAVGIDGTITLRTGRVDHAVELTVTDDGIGMAEEFIVQELFQPFHTTKSDGLGIGLFQCKKIIEAHKGSIWVESRIGTGTTVHVVLPAAEAAGNAEAGADRLSAGVQQ